MAVPRAAVAGRGVGDRIRASVLFECHPEMPKIDVSAVPVRVGTGYPEPFNDPCAAPYD